MRFMVMVKATKDSEDGKMPSEELLSAMAKFNEEMMKAGVMLDGNGLQPSSKGARELQRPYLRTVALQAVEVALSGLAWFVAVMWLNFAGGPQLGITVVIVTGMLVMFLTMLLLEMSKVIDDWDWVYKISRFSVFERKRWPKINANAKAETTATSLVSAKTRQLTMRINCATTATTRQPASLSKRCHRECERVADRRLSLNATVRSYSARRGLYSHGAFHQLARVTYSTI